MDKEIITYMQYDTDIRLLAEQIKNHIDEFDNIIGVPRGGLPIAVHLSHLLGLPLIAENRISERTLIVDDVSDTGKCLLGLDILPKQVATLYRKDGTKFEPRFFARTINRWICYHWER